MNVIIGGGNGVGKSSLFRMLRGIWPIGNGILKRPGFIKGQQSFGKEVLFISQKCYLPIGTLRDQVIYPDTL